MSAPAIGVALNGSHRSWPETVAMARQAEELGFDSVAMWDHPNAPGVDSPTALTALAMVTSTVRLWANVLAVPYRVPSTLGRALASLDVISGGRLVVGLGTGWQADEFRAYGIPFLSKRDRDSGLVEAIQIMRRLWEDEAASFDGTTWSLHEARCDPKPVQRPGPPIWVGSHGGPRLLTEVVARHADGCNLGIPSAVDAPPLDALVARLHRACEAAGRDADTMTLSTNLLVTGTKSGAGRPLRYAAHADPRKTLSLAVPAEVAARVHDLGELGMRHVMLAVDSDAIEEDLVALAELLLADNGAP